MLTVSGQRERKGDHYERVSDQDRAIPIYSITGSYDQAYLFYRR